MANQAILDKKQEIINEISEKTKTASTVVLFEYQGLSVEDTNTLRRNLRENKPIQMNNYRDLDPRGHSRQERKDN